MTYFVPEKIVAARAITIHGVTYAKDQVLTKAQVLAIPHLSALLASGRLKAVPDPHHRKAVKGGRTATNIPPKALAEMYADVDPGAPVTNYLVSATRTGRIVTLTIIGGQPDWTIDWDDSSTELHTGAPVTHHAYAADAAAKTYHIAITGGDGQVYAAYDVTIPAAPAAAFTSSVGVAALSKTATFTNTSTGVGNTHSWDFGDGTALVTTSAPVHVYGAAGTFHVTLTETNAQGVSSVTHDVVTT